MLIWYTSNYARHSDNPSASAISAKPPEWYTGAHITGLAPSWDILNKYRRSEIDEDGYATLYIAHIEQFCTPQSLFDRYKMFNENKFFLCYERPDEFCHRHVFAKWMNDANVGVRVEEWMNGEERKAYEQRQYVETIVEF